MPRKSQQTTIVPIGRIVPKIKKPIRQGSRAAKILLKLTDVFDLFGTFGYQPTAVLRHGIDGIREIRDAKERAYHRREMNRLKERRLIRLKKTAQGYAIALSPEGRVQAFRLKVLDSDLLSEGKVCMVVFDIPERCRSIRRQLRNFLATAGFMPIQRSVWISPFDAAEHLAELFKVTSSSRWVRMFTAEEAEVK